MPNLFDDFQTALKDKGYRLGRQWSHRREQSEITGYSVITTQPGLPSPYRQGIIVDLWQDGTFDVFVGHSSVQETGDVTALVNAILNK